MKANGSQVARIFNVNRNTVAGWTAAGCPVASRGRQGKEYEFDTGNVHRWLVEREVLAALESRAEIAPPAGGPYDLARARKMQADAEVAEIKLEEMRGRVVAVAEVKRISDDVMGVIRAKLFSMPTKLAVKLAAARSRDAAKEILTDGVNDCLAELQIDAQRARRGALKVEDHDEGAEDERA